MIKYNECWPITIAEVKLNDSLVDYVEEKVVPHLKSLESYNGSMYSDYFDNKIDLVDLVPELLLEVQKHAQNYAKHTNLKLGNRIQAGGSKAFGYWTQDYVENSFHARHSHGLHGVSGTYYVRANESAGPIKFYNPNQLSLYVNYQKDEKNNDDVFDDNYPSDKFIKPEKGKLVLFPSFLEHEVLACRPNAIRTSISFNF
jgi:uncharacterized protein (TIGR02466 family)